MVVVSVEGGSCGCGQCRGRVMWVWPVQREKSCGCAQCRGRSRGHGQCESCGCGQCEERRHVGVVNVKESWVWSVQRKINWVWLVKQLMFLLNHRYPFILLIINPMVQSFSTAMLILVVTSFMSSFSCSSHPPVF